MKVLIVEDEKPAADRLIKMLKETDSSIEVSGIVVSVASSVKWLESNEAPDLIFMDVNLADGSSFEIFEKTKVNSPVVFTTAYDEYALEAFRVNSIDYLLKPVKKEELERAMSRYRGMQSLQQIQVDALVKRIHQVPSYQKRMVIRYGEVIKMVDISEVSYFYTEDRIHYLCTFDNLRYPVDQNLDELESLLDPAVFFRINRQFIVNVNAIDRMQAWSKSRVKITLKPPSPHETVVSTDRSPVFKEWLTGRA
jgi:DNA-binding LytR/AlgR family response regulator